MVMVVGKKQKKARNIVVMSSAGSNTVRSACALMNSFVLVTPSAQPFLLWHGTSIVFSFYESVVVMDLVLPYSAMVLSQAYGSAIIGILWGENAKLEALAQDTDAVRPDLSYRELCNGYVAAHTNTYSNILHAAGMFGVLFLIAAVAAARKPRVALWIPPIYYLTAWTGHFVFQRDIPAVFTYGLTLKGWIYGESCAWEDLLFGGVERVELVFGFLLSAVIVYPLMPKIEIESTRLKEM